ncbi:vitamin K epoxide reductase family protein [Chryseobacterium sp. W4I1]|uniref:vitamin K epoxide reductase family protein n=1 Tax=Chryseobacterium sp. W4I1 TaxID=3042293 RepID=UPI002782431B|nr:vitamin K epoxide reductase family protein [Chryseobacterium sp. W4I1]MDQ0780931.1 disulfide bond formation protein DsbB [Chryseobacterium sp. W4I1]
MVESISNILKYLEKKNIYLDGNAFSFQINSHPSFPSLLSIVSALNVNHVYNYVIEIEDSEIDELPDDFMAFIELGENEQELAYIEKTKEGYLINGKHRISAKELLSKWSNIVVLIDETQSELKKKSIWKYQPYFVGISILILFAGLYYYINVRSFIHLVLSFCGFILSVLSLRKVFGIENSIVSKVCSGTYTDCSFSDAKNANFISSFGDYSLVYFFTNMISILFLSNMQNSDVFFTIQRLLLVVILPVIAYSLFYQLFKIKKICPLCIGIIIILLLQTSILMI